MAATGAPIWSVLLMGLASFIVNHVCGMNLPPTRTISSGHYHEEIRRLQAFKASLITRRDSIASPPSSFSPFPSPSPSPLPSVVNMLHTLFQFIFISELLLIKILALVQIIQSLRHFSWKISNV